MRAIPDSLGSASHVVNQIRKAAYQSSSKGIPLVRCCQGGTLPALRVAWAAFERRRVLQWPPVRECGTSFSVTAPSDVQATSKRPSPTARVAEMASKNLDQLADDCALQLLASPDKVGLRVQYGEMLMAQGDLESAEEHLRFAVQRQPDNGSARTELGKWYATRGDPESARSEWLLATQLDDAEGALLLGESYPLGEVPDEVIQKLEELMPSEAAMAGIDYVEILYYRMKFARASPVTILIPGEWQQAVSSRLVTMEDALRRWQSEQLEPGS